MRKWMISLGVILILFVLSIYLLLPRQLVLKKQFAVTANQNTVYRTLTDTGLLSQWMPRFHVGNPANYVVGSTSFQFTRMVVDMVNVRIDSRGENINTYIRIFPLKNDSTEMEWTGSKNTSSNPFKKIAQYFALKNIQKDVDRMITDYTQFVTNEELVYGVKVNRTMVTDTLLVTMAKETGHYPAVHEYYALINQLRSYIAASGATETNYPMLNITLLNDTCFEARVAIPINKEIVSTKQIQFKRMVPGKILTAEIKGGTGQVLHTMTQLDNYLLEHRMVSPAIPFQSLVTDRSQQPDSTKWITRLYYPVL